MSAPHSNRLLVPLSEGLRW